MRKEKEFNDCLVKIFLFISLIFVVIGVVHDNYLHYVRAIAFFIGALILIQWAKCKEKSPGKAKRKRKNSKKKGKNRF